MLWEAELPIGFWVAAVLMVNWLKNRAPTSALDCTPYEAWYGEKPNLGYVKTFGCRAQVHVPQEIRSKTSWDSHTTECLLLGHKETENLFVLWDIQRGAVICRRDVIFWEDQLGADVLRQHAFKRGMELFPP